MTDSIFDPDRSPENDSLAGSGAEAGEESSYGADVDAAFDSDNADSSEGGLAGAPADGAAEGAGETSHDADIDAGFDNDSK